MDMSSPILYNSQTPSSLRTPGARTPPSSRRVDLGMNENTRTIRVEQDNDDSDNSDTEQGN